MRRRSTPVSYDDAGPAEPADSKDEDEEDEEEEQPPPRRTRRAAAAVAEESIDNGDVDEEEEDEQPERRRRSGRVSLKCIAGRVPATLNDHETLRVPTSEPIASLHTPFK